MGGFLKATACLTVLLASTSFSAAQDNNAPRTLTPRTLLAPTEETASPNTTPVPVKTISGGINVQSLDAISSESLGVLSGSNAFPSDMWNGISRPIAERLIAKLPARPSAPYLRILQRRLLLSAATPPKGSSGPKSLLTLRAEKLAQMGQINDVLKLISSAPQNEKTNDLDMLQTRVLLIEDDVTKACAMAAQNIQQNDNPFWVKTLAFCRMMAKQGDQAQLSLSLLKEMGDKDPVYYNLMDALQVGERGKVDELQSPSALEIALIKATKAQLSDQVRNSDDANFLNYLTKAGDISATEKAVALNLASTQFLAQAYKNMQFTPAEQENPIATAENLDSFKAQALLYQVSAQEGQLPVIQSETISMALDLAKSNTRFLSTARLYRPLISTMPQSIDMLWFAPTAMRALLAAGDWETAKAWYLMLRNAAFTDSEAAKNWTDVRPLAVLAGFDVLGQAVSQSLKNWWQAQEETPESYEQAARLFALVDGLGLPVPDLLWISLMNGPRLSDAALPKPGLWTGMNKAAQAGDLGETILMMLNAIEDRPLKDMEDTFIHDALAAMRKIGLERDARAVAVETALQAGL
ncbi:MAG: hypothetical protein HWE30_02020 [Methylocystaceae bacterium]|nr:hypothetical protein [Methylocystaceae bacterium]